jgi:hypothetical protein
MEPSHKAPTLPPLPLEEWEATKETLHRYCQIVGKVRMEHSPYRNHWWHVTLYVTTRGLTTGPIPHGDTIFDISFDLLENRLAVTTSEGGAFSFALDDLPVAEFYRRLFQGLGSLGIDASINTKPFDLDDEHTLDSNTYHSSYDGRYVRRYHRVLAEVDQIFKEFAGRFTARPVPVQLYWHSFRPRGHPLLRQARPPTRGHGPGHARRLLARGHLLRVLARGPGSTRADLLLLHRTRAPGPHRTTPAPTSRILDPAGRYGAPDVRGSPQQ